MIKKDLLRDQYEEFCDIINDAENEKDLFDNMSFSFDWILNYNDEIKHEFINTGDLFRSDLDEYINALTKYNKYNKLYALKNNSNLHDDIVFKVIMKYL